MTATDKRCFEVETLGIVSASNEAGCQLTEAQNDRRDEHLRGDLLGYETHQARGYFGDIYNPMLSMINPHIIVNIARETAVTLGIKYQQFHVMFGVREGSTLRFELLEADWMMRVLAARKLFSDPDQQQSYISAACPDDHGRVFVLPSFTRIFCMYGFNSLQITRK